MSLLFAWLRLIFLLGRLPFLGWEQLICVPFYHCFLSRRQVLIDVLLDEQKIDHCCSCLSHPPLRLHLCLLHHPLWIGEQHLRSSQQILPQSLCDASRGIWVWGSLEGLRQQIGEARGQGVHDASSRRPHYLWLSHHGEKKNSQKLLIFKISLFSSWTW